MDAAQFYELVINWIKKRPYMARLERLTSRSTSHFDSIALLATKKVRVIIEFLIKSIISTPDKRRQRLRETRAIRKSRSNMEALVLANGPSVQKLNVRELEKLQAERRLEIFLVNFMPLAEFVKKLEASYFLVLSDPETRPDVKSQSNLKLWELIRTSPGIRLILPVSWSRIDAIVNLTNRVLYFNDLSLEGWSNNTSPVRPRGYSSITAYKALAFAKYLGYSKINILGFDNSLFQTIFVSRDNRLMQRSNHFKGSESNYEISHLYPHGPTDYFYDLSLLYFDLRKKFRAENILNLDSDSLVDAFRKPGSHRLINED